MRNIRRQNTKILCEKTLKLKKKYLKSKLYNFGKVTKDGK